MGPPRQRDPKKLFGARLRQLRRARAFSQEELAGRAGLDRTYISGCERGMRNPSLVTVAKLASALNVEIGDLFPRHTGQST